MNTGRWTCPRCGSNNFDTVTQCWKCNSARIGGAVAPPPPAASTPVYNVPQERVASAPVFPAAMSLPSGGDPQVAKRAAILLALSLPYIGLPVGWAFMMVEDYKKQAIGRFCVWWSCVGLIVHLVFGFIALQSLTAVALKVLVPMLSSQNGKGLEMPTGGSNPLNSRELNP